MPLINRLSRKRPEALDPAVHAALVDSLYGPLASLVSGAIGGILCALIIAWLTNSVLMLLCAVAMTVVGAFRIIIMKAYRDAPPSQEPNDILRWERLYGAGAISFSALLGIFCFIAVYWMNEPGVHLLVSAVTLGYSSAISGRNAARPHIVVPQILLATGPLAVALCLHGDPLYFALAFMLLLNFVSIRGIAVAIHKTLFKALDATHENERLIGVVNTAMRNMSHGLCMVDAEDRVAIANDRFSEILGLEGKDEIVGKRLSDVLHSSGQLQAKDVGTVDAWGGRGNAMLTLGNDRIISMSMKAAEDGGRVLVTEDITERRRAEEAIERLAKYDALTGLPNRSSFNAECSAILPRMQANGERGALLSIDLDHFKQVNDTLGHPVGDELLRAVALRLGGLVRQGDVVARFGGDEFVVLLAPVSGPDEALAMADGIIEGLSGTYLIDDQQVIIGATVGIAIAFEDGDGVDALIKNSDLALFRAKGRARGTACLFEAGMDVRAQNRRQIDLDLRAAIEQQAFELYFQPIVDLAGGRTKLCEALIRWNHPSRGLVSPLEFIPIAEETGTIVPLGEWILREACRQAKQWPADIGVAVNLSPVQFRFSGLVDSVRKALAETGLAPSRLELEITESVLMENGDVTRRMIDELRQLGVRLSLDDFGTGYSSLSYLHELPFDKVKIDRQFIKDVHDTESSRAIVQSVGHIARAMGMQVVAEGIEIEAQAKGALAAGCALGQGYLFARPMPAPAAGEYLTKEVAAYEAA